MKRLLITTSALAALVLGGMGQASAQSQMLRGDANHDGKTSLVDALVILNWQFLSQSAPLCIDAADVNDNGVINLIDPLTLLNYLFIPGSAAPSAPFPVWDLDPTADTLSCKGNIITKTGTLAANETWEVENTYLLESLVVVPAGVILTIEPGVTVLGDVGTDAVLLVERGGRIVAQGTEFLPIVFTTENAVGSRAPGDWGGLVLLGYGENNIDNGPTGVGGTPGGEGIVEGFVDEHLYGGGALPVADDDSGVLSYVRVEFGGTEISANNEINAITLASLGSETQVDHVMCKYNLDDGVEWFGGSVNASFLLCIGIQDDNFDYATGWTGRGQFWVCQQTGEPVQDGGFEVDNSEEDFSYLPLTQPIISNVTLIGDPKSASAESEEGLLFRRGAGTNLYNAIVMGWRTAGLDIDDGATTEHDPTNGELVMDYCVFYDNNENFRTGETGANEEVALNGFNYTTPDFATSLNSNNTELTDNPVHDPYDYTTPDFRGVGTVLPAAIDPTTLDSFFSAADYIGGVTPDGTAIQNWTVRSWISYQSD